MCTEYGPLPLCLSFPAKHLCFRRVGGSQDSGKTKYPIRPLVLSPPQGILAPGTENINRKARDQGGRARPQAVHDKYLGRGEAGCPNTRSGPSTTSSCPATSSAFASTGDAATSVLPVGGAYRRRGRPADCHPAQIGTAGKATGFRARCRCRRSWTGCRMEGFECRFDMG